MKNLNNFICYDNDLSATLVIFGGTGDLTHRKLMPALYNLFYEDLLPTSFLIVSIGRREYNDSQYIKEVKESIKNFSRFGFDELIWDEFKKRLYYRQLNFADGSKYCELNEKLNEIEEIHQVEKKRIFYLAVAPEYFETIIDNLNTNCMGEKGPCFPKVVIEKPFGRDLESASYLNDKIVHVFKEENTFRIDHYLGKEMLQSILTLRFANTLFDAVWNHKYIDQVQIISSETLGVETRGEYYEASGAIRDMLQSHLLQLLSLIAMEKPKDLSTNSIRDEKVKVLKALKKYSETEVKKNVVRGQYGPSSSLLGYRQEKNVSPNSQTETFVALKAIVENERWQNVPFYILTGKRLETKAIEIIIEFKKFNDALFDQKLTPNYLIIKIQPEEGVSLEFNTKEAGPFNRIIPVKMDFCQNCQVGINTPEAYERLLYDVIRQDATLFTRWDEVEEAWKFVDAILNAWKNEIPDFPNYEAKSYGPNSAIELLKKENKKWLYSRGNL